MIAPKTMFNGMHNRYKIVIDNRQFIKLFVIAKRVQKKRNHVRRRRTEVGKYNGTQKVREREKERTEER